MFKTAVLVAVGDELLSGIRKEGNCSFLARHLHDAGWKLLHIEVIPDDLPRIIETLNRWIGKTDMLVLSGGLGPTHDDKTRYALAEYLKCGLAVNDALYDRVSSRYEGSMRELVERSRPIQGLVPQEAAGVYNPAGSALGIYFEKDGTKIWSFPGVPFEYKAMVAQEIAPLLSVDSDEWTWKSVSVVDIPESLAAEKISEIVADQRLHISILPSYGLVEFVFRGEKDLVNLAVQKTRLKLARYALPEECLTLPEAILAAGRKKGLTLSCAESCTGGGIAAYLTDLPGMSEVFMGSAVVYSNEAKKNLLGVEQAILDTHGAVSDECVTHMALGAMKLYGTSLSVAVTGIAGPSGGSAEKPVGTAWFAVASQTDDSNDWICSSFPMHFSGERDVVRGRAIHTALRAAWRKMMDMPGNKGRHNSASTT